MKSAFPALVDGSDALEFVAAPPAEIGEVIGAWTNMRPGGPAPPPLATRLVPIGLGAMGGFVVGLVAFFAIGGYLESRGADITGDELLGALAAGTLIGAAIGTWVASRPIGTLTLFVGTEGCAQVEGRGDGAKAHVLLYRDVASFHTHVNVMVHSGIRTAIREVHVRDPRGKDRLWYLTAPPGEQKPGDPQYAFAEAVLRAHAAHAAIRASGAAARDAATGAARSPSPGS